MFDMNHQANSIQYSQMRLNSNFDNLSNQFTPGYKEEQANFHSMVTGQGGRGPMVKSTGIVFEQGQIVKTANPTDLAVEGNGFMVVNDGIRNHFTRDGRFTFQNGQLVNVNGNKVMGYQLDDQGNVSSELQPISLTFDPQSKLYGGKYTSYHFDNSGKLYGERTTVDPLTGNAVSVSVPLFQAGLAAFANPSGLSKSSNTSFVESDNSGPPVIGTAGQGALGRVHPGSLEMSTVDFARQSAAIGMTKQNYQANFASFQAMDAMRKQALGLIR